MNATIMKKTTIAFVALLFCLLTLTTACSDFTDLKPKGKNLLSTTDQLEMLLNYEFYLRPRDEMAISGDFLSTYKNVPSQLSLPGKTRDVIMWTWDAGNQDKMAELTSSDTDYDEFYSIIGRICNPILSQIDAAGGSEAKKRQLKCEALTLRAYFHYLLVNKFARAYNPATAATDRGIIYMTEDKSITDPQAQSTLQEVYDNILKDINEAIDIDGLPDAAVNRMRVSKAAAYAVKALVLRSMQQWSEAEEAADKALAIDSVVNNYNDMLNQTVNGNVTGGTYKALLRPQLQCEEDLFYTHYTTFYDCITPEEQARIEKGNLALEKLANTDMAYDYTVSASKLQIGLDGYMVTFDGTSGWNSAGMKTTDMYLVVAEAELHNGHIDKAMEALDKIRVNRIATDVYKPLKGQVTTEAEAIRHIKQTSEGEGLFSIYNFINKKRWNQVGGWEETYTRDLAGKTYTLTPESPMWIFPLPLNAVSNNPNLKQNYK